MITQERLKEFLSYCPDTGVFAWRRSRGTAKAGSIAGCVNKRGYRIIRIDMHSYKAHRLVFLYMTGSFPARHTDHINGVTFDNRWLNLRDVTSQENSRNQKRRSNNTSGLAGVKRDKPTNKWRVFINFDLKQQYLGYYDDFFEACCARKSAETKHDFHPNHGR